MVFSLILISSFGQQLIAVGPESSAAAHEFFSADDPRVAPAKTSSAVPISPISPEEAAPTEDSAFKINVADVLMLLLAAVFLVVIVQKQWFRLDRLPRPPGLADPLVLLVLFLLGLALAAIGMMVSAQVFGIEHTAEREVGFTLVEQSQLMLGMYLAQSIVLVAFAFLLLRARSPQPDRRSSWAQAALVGGVALVLIWPLMSVAGFFAGGVAQFLTGDRPDPVAHETLRRLLEEPWSPAYVAMVIGVVLIAPLVEEVLYRGLLQRALRGFGIGPWPAVIATSAAFALMHLGSADVHALAALFVLSLAFGWAYERTGRLIAPVLMHILFNAGNLALALTLA